MDAARCPHGPITRISTKGQVVLPKACASDAAGSAGDELVVEERPEGVLLRRAARAEHHRAWKTFSGSLGPVERSAQIDEMNQARPRRGGRNAGARRLCSRLTPTSSFASRSSMIALRFVVRDALISSRTEDVRVAQVQCFLKPNGYCEAFTGNRREGGRAKRCAISAHLPTVVVGRSTPRSRRSTWAEAGMDFADALHLAGVERTARRS